MARGSSSINLLADISEKGIAQSHGLMVNYLYDLDDIEKNHEAYAESRTIVAANGIRKRARSPREPGQGLRQRRLPGRDSR